MKYRFKAIDSVKKGVLLKEPRLTDLPAESYKFASLKYVRNNVRNDYVQYVLDSIPIRGNHKSILVDIKTHHLKAGQIPALPHWHFDCVKNPLYDSCSANRDKMSRFLSRSVEEVHHIFISSPYCRTEFLAESFETDLDPLDGPRFDDKIGDVKGAKIEACRIYSYKRHLHRATPAEQDCTRLLVRVTESDIIKPHNRPFEPTYRRRD